MGALYEIKDFFTTSEMESKRKKYKKLVKSLSEDISYIEKMLEHLLSYRATEKKIMLGDYNDGIGILVTKYDNKLEEFNDDTERLIYYFETKLELVKYQLTQVQETLRYYEEQCRLEDQMQQEFSG